MGKTKMPATALEALRKLSPGESDKTVLRDTYARIQETLPGAANRARRTLLTQVLYRVRDQGLHPDHALLNEGLIGVKDMSPEGMRLSAARMVRENHAKDMTGFKDLEKDLDAIFKETVQQAGGETVREGGEALAEHLKSAKSAVAKLARTGVRVGTGALKAVDVPDRVRDLYEIGRNAYLSAKIRDEMKRRGIREYDMEDREEQPNEQPGPKSDTEQSEQNDDEGNKYYNNSFSGGWALEEVKGSSGDDELETQHATPEAKAFVAEVAKPGRVVDDIVLKDPRDWTEPERDQVMTRVATLSGTRRQPEADDLDRRVRDWFEYVYGTAPVAYDVTGRMIQPKPKRPVAARPKPLTDPRGRPVDDQLIRIGRDLVERSDGRNFKGAVKSLQSGLNLMNEVMRPVARPRRPLKTDGVYGNKTRRAVRGAAAKLGAGKVREAMALGGFGEFAERARHRGTASGLARETARNFGELFRGTRYSPPGDGLKPAEENVALQDTLNELGERKLPGYAPLKTDGVIGPKTQGAFDQVNGRTDTGELLRSFGTRLGFFD